MWLLDDYHLARIECGNGKDPGCEIYVPQKCNIYPLSLLGNWHIPHILRQTSNKEWCSINTEPSEYTVEYDLQMKAASTVLLDYARMNPTSSVCRCIQNILMETEQDLREKQRKSLDNFIPKWAFAWSAEASVCLYITSRRYWFYHVHRAETAMRNDRIHIP